MILRYCRFYWPCLLAINKALTVSVTPYHLARHVWHVGYAVIRRAASLRKRLCPWVEELYREITDGKPMRKFTLMVKIITAKIGRFELVQRWYRHWYHR
jgi:hypothetical protein